MQYMSFVYTGIGSRETPQEYLDMFERMGVWLGLRGGILRSGGANGADSAFERGADKVKAIHPDLGEKEIYLPWKGFNNNTSLLYNIDHNAMVIAQNIHPNWNKLSDAAKKLMARNTYQIIGLNNTLTDFVVCYTKNGKYIGGTSQAMKLADMYEIPIFNAGNYKNSKEAAKTFNIFYNEIIQEKNKLVDEKEIM